MKKLFWFIAILASLAPLPACAQGAPAPKAEEVVVTMSLETVR